jgi:hypothetical protein
MGKLHHTNFRSVVLFIIAVLTSILAYSSNPLTQYLSQLPEPESSACGNYKYQTIQEEKAYQLWNNVSGVLVFDVFYYSSNGTLPDLPIRPNKYWEPIGNWMYYHD